MTVDPEELISSDETARLLSVKAQTLAAWRHAGRGPVYLKIGRGCFYRREDIRAWLGTLVKVPSSKAA